MQEQRLPAVDRKQQHHCSVAGRAEIPPREAVLPADPVKGGCALQIKNLWFIAETTLASAAHGSFATPLFALLVQRTRHVPTVPAATDLPYGVTFG